MGADWRVNRGGVDVPGQSAQAQKAAQLALAREERRRQAECDAQRLVTEARSLDPEVPIPHTLRLLRFGGNRGVGG